MNCWENRPDNFHLFHSFKLLNSLNLTRGNSNLCDGVIVVKGENIHVQKAILAAASPYFRALYEHENHGNGSLGHPHIDDINCIIFKQILDYIYTSFIDINEENIQDVLQAADLLLMDDLKDICCEYLESYINASNCLEICNFSDQYNCPRVKHMATSYIDEHFGEVTYSEEFSNLTSEQLKFLLMKDSLSVQTEDIIFDCVMRWCRHDRVNRCKDLSDIIRNCIRMGLIDQRYLQEHILSDELIRSLELERVLLYLHKEDGNPTPRGFTNMVVVVGGEGPCDSDPGAVEIKASVRCIDIHDSPEAKYAHWIDLTPMTHSRIGHGLVVAGGSLFAIGGRDTLGRHMRSGEVYDPRSDQWKSIASMHHARIGFGLVNIGDKIYALGGSNDMTDPLTSVEVYSIYANEWKELPDMNLKRVWSAYAVVNNKIYVIGGGTMGKVYEEVECFDPKSETWISVAPMKERRFDARAIGFEGDLYVFGGLRRLECPSAMNFNGNGMKFCGTEVYCTNQKIWRTIGKNLNMCSMTYESHIDAVAWHGDEILLIGDLKVDSNEMTCIRGFRPSTNTWRGIIRNHPSCQRGMQACTMKIPNRVIHNHSRVENRSDLYFHLNE